MLLYHVVKRGLHQFIFQYTIIKLIQENMETILNMLNLNKVVLGAFFTGNQI